MQVTDTEQANAAIRRHIAWEPEVILARLCLKPTDACSFSRVYKSSGHAHKQGCLPVHETAWRLVVPMGPSKTGATMSLPRTVTDVIRDHVTLELECIDRMYLNVYQADLQMEHHVFHFLREQRGTGAVSSRCFQEMTRSFVHRIETYAQEQNIPVIPFENARTTSPPSSAPPSRVPRAFTSSARLKKRCRPTAPRADAIRKQAKPIRG